MNDQLMTSHHLALFNKVGQSSLFVANLHNKKQEVLGLTFPGQMITYGVKYNTEFISQKDPIVTVFTEDRAKKTAFWLKLKFKRSSTTIEDC